MQVSPGPWDSPAVVMRSTDMAPKITGGGAGSRWRGGAVGRWGDGAVAQWWGDGAMAPLWRGSGAGGAVAPLWRRGGAGGAVAPLWRGAGGGGAGRARVAGRWRAQRRSRPVPGVTQPPRRRDRPLTSVTQMASARPAGRPAPQTGPQMLRNTTEPAKKASPVVLRTLFMHSSTGLAVSAEVVVLCRFWTGAMAPAPLPFPSAVYRAARQSRLRALKGAGAPPARRRYGARSPAPLPFPSAIGSAPAGVPRGAHRAELSDGEA
jgi:hypothetical protein